jgi:hypothetical protein
MTPAPDVYGFVVTFSYMFPHMSIHLDKCPAREIAKGQPEKVVRFDSGFPEHNK